MSDIYIPKMCYGCMIDLPKNNFGAWCGPCQRKRFNVCSLKEVGCYTLVEKPEKVCVSCEIKNSKNT